MTGRDDAIVAIYATHDAAESGIRKVAEAGLDMKRFCIIGKGHHTEAPPFRALHQRYPIADLARPLSEGIVTGHPSMPRWRLDPGQVDDVIAYLKAVQD